VVQEIVKTGVVPRANFRIKALRSGDITNTQVHELMHDHILEIRW
jgi:hypothetical protein